jgi:hypothetical protein
MRRRTLQKDDDFMSGASSEGSATDRYRLFLSHGGNDRWVARQIRDKLTLPELDCFLDATDIEIGDNFRAVILDEIDRCHELLVFLTPSSLQRAWVFAEIGAAITKRKRIVAIRFGLEMDELHKRGVVSLIGDTQIVELDMVDTYIVAVSSRARRHVNGQ